MVTYDFYCLFGIYGGLALNLAILKKILILDLYWRDCL